LKVGDRPVYLGCAAGKCEEEYNCPVSPTALTNKHQNPSTVMSVKRIMSKLYDDVPFYPFEMISSWFERGPRPSTPEGGLERVPEGMDMVKNGQFAGEKAMVLL
jgi:hypothetical protein